MRLLVLSILAVALLAPTVADASGLDKCYGALPTAGACIDYDAINDFCASVWFKGNEYERCVNFVGPPI